MKTILITAAALLFAIQTRAVTIWEQDSDLAMQVHSTGINPNQTVDFTSPSGLWQLSGLLYVFPTEPSEPVGIRMGFALELLFADTLKVTHFRFDDVFFTPLLTSRQPWFSPSGYTFFDWEGLTTFSVTPQDLGNISTWTWDLASELSGPRSPFDSLEPPPMNVPDTGGTLLCLAIGCVAIAAGRKTFLTQ